MSSRQLAAAAAALALSASNLSPIAIADIDEDVTEGAMYKDPNDPTRIHVDFTKEPGKGKGNGGSGEGNGGQGGGGGAGNGGREGGSTHWTDKSGGAFDKPGREGNDNTPNIGRQQAPKSQTKFTGGTNAPSPRPAPTPDEATRKKQAEEMRRQWELYKEMAQNAANGLPDAAERLKDAVERNPDYLEWFGKHGTKLNVGWTIVEIMLEAEGIGVDQYPYDYRYSDFGKWMQAPGDLSNIGAPPFDPVPESDGSSRVIPESEKAKRKGFDSAPQSTSR